MKKKVLATGVFDILHPGHIYFLEQAKKLGDELIVLITCDKVAKSQKRQPLFSQIERQNMLKCLNFIDKVVVGNEDLDYARTIREIKPDIIALGYDQEILPNQLNDIQTKAGFKGKIVKINKYPKLDLSTSLIIERIETGLKARIN